MNFAGRDTNFSAHAELSPVRKLGRRVVQQDGAVQIMQKALGCLLIFRDDGFGMSGTVLFDMRYSLLQAVNGPSGQGKLVLETEDEAKLPVIEGCNAASQQEGRRQRGTPSSRWLPVWERPDRGCRDACDGPGYCRRLRLSGCARRPGPAALT